MPINSRRKGATYERELADQLRQYGYDVRRTVQYCGKSGEAADLIGLPNIHIECKRYANIGFSYDWLKQAVRDSKKGTLPTVFHRINGEKTVVTMDLDDWMYLYSNSSLADGGANG